MQCMSYCIAILMVLRIEVVSNSNSSNTTLFRNSQITGEASPNLISGATHAHAMASDWCRMYMHCGAFDETY